MKNLENYHVPENELTSLPRFILCYMSNEAFEQWLNHTHALTSVTSEAYKGTFWFRLQKETIEQTYISLLGQLEQENPDWLHDLLNLMGPSTTKTEATGGISIINKTQSSSSGTNSSSYATRILTSAKQKDLLKNSIQNVSLSHLIGLQTCVTNSPAMIAPLYYQERYS